LQLQQIHDIAIEDALTIHTSSNKPVTSPKTSVDQALKKRIKKDEKYKAKLFLIML